jgi:hypothetical protein
MRDHDTCGGGRAASCGAAKGVGEGVGEGVGVRGGRAGDARACLRANVGDHAPQARVAMSKTAVAVLQGKKLPALVGELAVACVILGILGAPPKTASLFTEDCGVCRRYVLTPCVKPDEMQRSCAWF